MLFSFEIGFPFFFLIGSFFLAALNNSLKNTKKRIVIRQLKKTGIFFFYRRLHKIFFQDDELEGLIFVTTYALNIARFFYTFSIALTFDQALYMISFKAYAWYEQALIFLLPLGLFLLLLLISDLFPRIWANTYPEGAIKGSAPIASLFLCLFFPISLPFFKLSKKISRRLYLESHHESFEKTAERILEIIKETGLDTKLEAYDKKLLESAIFFRDIIVREVMVPRVALFTLPADTPINKAVRLLQNTGFSRVPIYKGHIDEIIGILMYKDLLAKYVEYEKKGGDFSVLEVPISTIIKPVFYVPETKKISFLLQDFRNRQVHLAVVVDEYGRTTGIVTLEDLLEEIVGKIGDEYDKKRQFFHPLPAGGWIVNAQMSLLDIEEQLGIILPQEGEYDTIGGYVFHRTGTIPSKGFVIQQDDFEIEILSSNERRVEKVRLSPLKKHFDSKELQMD